MEIAKYISKDGTINRVELLEFYKTLPTEKQHIEIDELDGIIHQVNDAVLSYIGLMDRMCAAFGTKSIATINGLNFSDIECSRCGGDTDKTRPFCDSCHRDYNH